MATLKSLASVPMLVCILGFIVWVVCTHPKFANSLLAKAGEWAYFAGLLAWVWKQ